MHPLNRTTPPAGYDPNPMGFSLGHFEPTWLGERVAQPTLIVHDRGDVTAPLVGSETLLAGLPAGRLHVTEGLGHRRLLSDPAVMQQVLAHLSATPSLRAV